ncbi:toxin-activating lysine-acyltransferase [Lysobacter tyrosinilyticus]
MTDSIQTTPASPAGAPHTIAEALGQIVWLLSQSPLHRELKLKDLEWSFMPAIVKEQFRIFRFGPLAALDGVNLESFQKAGMSREGLEQLPLGIAVWAYLSEAAEQKLEQGEHLALEDWKSGDRLWLVEFVAPFSSSDNKLGEAMMFDLMQGPFKGKTFYLHRTDPNTGRRDKIKLNGVPAEMG